MRRAKETIYLISAVLILVSAVLYLMIPSVAPWIMALSVAAFSTITALSPYPGKSIRGKRLFNFQVLSSVLMVVATFLMFRNNNLWALVMLLGAVFLLYSAIMTPKVFEKEKSDGENL